MIKRISRDPAFYLLIAFNAWAIYEYKQQPEIYPTLVWIFWCQSVIIGLFTFLELLTTKNVNAGEVTMNGKPVDPRNARGCYAVFFLVHYGGFHIGYLVYVAIKVGFNHINPLFFKLSLALLFANQLFTFFRHKQAFKTSAPDLAYLFFAPYMRIVPMHLMILGPAFLGWQPAMIFLVLKALMDVAGYLLTLRITGAGNATPDAV